MARTGFGTLNLMQATEYPLTRMTQDQNLLTSLYRDNWIAQNIITTIPDDIIRKWYELNTSIDPDAFDKYRRQEKQTHLRDRLSKGMYWGRLYGGAVGVILIKGDSFDKPLDVSKIKLDSFKGMHIFDRWTGVEPSAQLVMDISDVDYGLPEYYSISNGDMVIARVHHSRVVRFIGRTLPWIEQVAENYWGESELEAVYQEVVKRDNVSANIALLTFKANRDYMEVEGLDQLLGTANAQMQQRFWHVLQAQSIMESNFGMRAINKGDAIHNTQFTFTGLADTYDRIMMDVAGASKTPVTKLFGRSPAGLNATGESDLKNYYDYIDNLRETIFRGYLERLVPIMCMSAWGNIPEDLDIDFETMSTPTASEEADIVQKKSAAIISAFQVGVIDQATALEELRKIGFDKITNEMIEQGKGVTSAQSMNDPFAGLSNYEDNAENESAENAGAHIHTNREGSYFGNSEEEGK